MNIKQRLDAVKKEERVRKAAPALLEALMKARKYVWSASYDNLLAQEELIEIDAAIAAAKGE